MKSSKNIRHKSSKYNLEVHTTQDGVKHIINFRSFEDRLQQIQMHNKRCHDKFARKWAEFLEYNKEYKMKNKSLQP